MNPLLNPYAPGAGTQPPELAGRDTLLTLASIAIQRIAAGKSARGVVLTGLRGVGKTVLLNRIRLEAETKNIITVRMEVPEGRSLPSLLAPALKSAILKLQGGRSASDLLKRGFQALSMFVSAMKLKYQDIEVGFEFENNSTFPHLESLDDSLTQVIESIGSLAKEKNTAIVFFIDEIHLLPEKELSSLIMALHRASQDAIPVTLIAAGLPQIMTAMGEAKTYAERLFEFQTIAELDEAAATQALVVPIKKLNVAYTDDALQEIINKTARYAYFIQEWGRHAWDVAASSPITLNDAIQATALAQADLDGSFFRMRFEQLTPTQKEYIQAMAILGKGPHASGEIATQLNKTVTQISSIRDQLIHKGIIYSPSYGETAFTVPLFDAFIRRTMPTQ
ncbi:MAG TPA: ATP-binding protein [Gammaproteobacteria bacterium]|nr:ATP-binding protein [Gammaproteobacteria bacterium]